MSHRSALRARYNQQYIYSGRSLLVTNTDGEVSGAGTEGLYVENTRIISLGRLTANKKPLTPVASSPAGGQRQLCYLEVPQSRGVPAESVYLTVDRTISTGMREMMKIENFATRETASFALVLELDADFADADEAESGKREQTAPVEVDWNSTSSELRFRYCHPALPRSAVVHVVTSSIAYEIRGKSLVFHAEVEPRGSATFSLEYVPVFEDLPALSDGSAETAAVRLSSEIPVLTSSNDTVARAWRTASADLATMPFGLESGPAATIAGVPLYQQFFGRDTLTTAWQALLAMPSMMHDALRANAALQGKVLDDWLDEEPGKLIHQATNGPLATLGLTPFVRYYGDYATPPDFLIMLGQYLAWTNDIDTVRQLVPAAREVIDWIEHYGDLDGDGFLEYVARSPSPRRPNNLGWKDSNDAIVDEAGDVVQNPIATSEIQAYLYAGYQQAGLAFAMAGDVAFGLELLGRARDLKKRFDEAFWLEDLGFYALALGPDKRPIRSVASNAGHLLAAGIVPRAKGVRVAQRLMQADLFSGWGIRTLSSSHPAYNPFSYHRGSVWPVENGTFAFGFARYGCWEELWQLAEGIFAATDLFIENRLPEAIGGMPRDAEHPHPGIYRRSCEPQSWSASAIVMVVQALLGLVPIAPLGVVVVDPHLPPWMPDLQLRGVRVGSSLFDLELTRRGEATKYRARRRSGRIRVLRQPPPQSAEATALGRLAAAFGSVWTS